MNDKRNFRAPLTKKVARTLAIDFLAISESVHGVPFNPRPVSVGRIEIGWLFEFAPTKQFDYEGRKVYHVRCVVDDVERRVHGVGSAGVGRVIDEILWRRGSSR